MFLGRAEGSFQDGRSRIKYFVINNKIYDMKTTIGTLSIDNEIHDDDVRNSRRTGSRFRSRLENRKLSSMLF